MTRAIGSGVLAMLIQFILLTSHKAGQAHWAPLAAVSLVLFVLGVWRVKVSSPASTWRDRNLAFLAIVGLSLVGPPILYITEEYQRHPGAIANTFAQEGWLFPVAVFIVSGGWLFAFALLWMRRALSGATR